MLLLLKNVSELHCRWLLPALGGGPGCIFGHFSCRRLSVVRTFNAAKHGKSRKLPPDQLFPLDTAKETGKACLPRAWPLNRHAGVWGRASPAQKFEAQLSQSRGKITQKKRRRRTKICSQQRPIGGRIRNKNTTINQINVSINILGACL